MATGKARFSVSSRTGRATVAGIALDLAIRALRSEPVQQQLRNAPAMVIDQVRARRSGRAAPTVVDTTLAGPVPTARDPRRWLGQAALERRSRRLRDAMATLVTGNPSSTHLRDAADRVNAALDAIDRQLTVADALPMAKRTRAHVQVGRDLDRLEKALWQTVRDEPAAGA